MADTWSPSEGSTLSKPKSEKGKNNDVQQNKQILVPNQLHQYASFNYVWTLSGLSEEEIRDPQLYRNSQPHDIIARTGGIGPGNKGAKIRRDPDTVQTTYVDTGGENFSYINDTQQKTRDAARKAQSILDRNHDIFFKRVIMTGTHVPNPDKKMMNFNKLEATLTEPLGVTLYEKLRGAAWNCGYMDHVDAPFLLTLEFKGYDTKGNPVQDPVAKKFYPIKISKVTMNIDQSGATYDLIAIPWTEFAHSNRFLYTRGTFKIEGTEIDEKFASIQNGLRSVQETEIKKGLRQYVDDYRITIDPELKKTMVQEANSVNDTDFGADGKQTKISDAQVNPNTAVSKILETIMLRSNRFKDIPKIVQENWSKGSTSDGPESEMVDWFKIVTTVYTETGFDTVTKMHKKKILYHVKPYKLHILDFVVPGLSAAKLYGKSVKKDYQYIFTGQNFDIIDLTIDYKYSYFQSRLVNSGRSDSLNDQHDTSEKPKINDYYGKSKYPEPLLPFRSYPGISSSEDGITKDGAVGAEDRTNEFFDYLTNSTGDMVKVEMKIMGDPSYLGDDAYEPIKLEGDSIIQKAKRVGSVAGKVWNDKTSSFNLDEGEALITLHFRFPQDIDEKTGNYKFKSQEEIQFSGLYKVARVESEFNDGQFTQMLTMMRLNNQAGTTEGKTAVVKKEDINYNEGVIQGDPF